MSDVALLSTVTCRNIMLFAVEKQPTKWKAALLGALVCGILGLTIGTLLTLAHEAVLA